MPKVNKLLSYKKCRRCRYDKAKCLPEAREWPGEKCLRCQRFNYDCSARLTKAEEASDAQCRPVSASISDTSARLVEAEETSDIRYRSVSVTNSNTSALLEKTILQYEEEYDDLCRLHNEIAHPETRQMNHGVFEELDDRLRAVQKVLMDQVSQYEKDGMEREAELLLCRITEAYAPTTQGRLREWIYDSETSALIRLVSLSQASGSYWRAIQCQESIIRSSIRLYCRNRPEDAVRSLFDQYQNFVIRIEALSLELAIEYPLAYLVILRRIIAMDIHVITSEAAKRFASLLLWDNMVAPECMLHLAAQYDKADAIYDIMANSNANIDCKDDSRSAPLHIALQIGNWAAARALLGKGANVHQTDGYGNTPLLKICKTEEFCSLAILRDLVNKGALINATNNDGETSLHIAVEEGHLEVVKLLLRVGASEHLQDKWGMTPFTIAIGQRGKMFDLFKSF